MLSQACERPLGWIRHRLGRFSDDEIEILLALSLKVAEGVVDTEDNLAARTWSRNSSQRCMRSNAMTQHATFEWRSEREWYCQTLP